MMFGYFYNKTFRNYILLMANLFSDLYVPRERNGKGVLLKVPISYAPKEHFVERIENAFNQYSQKNEDKPSIARVETILPRIGLNIIDVQYSEMFKTNVTNRRVGNSLTTQYNPVPYKIMFQLSIYARNIDDGFCIVEQILPYFQPNFTATIKEQYKNDIVIDKRDIQITYQSMILNEDFEGDRSQRRYIEYDLTFELDGYFYPPMSGNIGEIRTIYMDFNTVEKDLVDGGFFESVDLQISPLEMDISEWEGKYIHGISENTPIPETDPSTIRGSITEGKP